MRDIIYTEDTVHFDCECCGKPVVLKKHLPETVKTSVICTGGNIRYWIKWSEGILRKDPVLTHAPELAQKILEMIERTEQGLANTLQGAIEDVAFLNKSIDDIKQLCQEEVNKQ